MYAKWLLLAVSALVAAQDDPALDALAAAYSPGNITCPKDVRVRDAKDLSEEEKKWRSTRLEKVHAALGDYLENAAIPDFNITDFTSKLKKEDAPVIGLAISGGGTQSGVGGLGVYQAFDSRYAPAVEAGTGGLAQLFSYFTGLSGGGALTVSTMAANNFTSIADLTQAINFTVNYEAGPTGNQTEYFGEIFYTVAGKAEAGFPVTATDVFGRFWATYLPEELKFGNLSDIAKEGTAFASGDAPMPLVAMVEIIPGVSPQIGGIMYPGNNATNGFNLTSYEINPFEFGSWSGGRVQAFFPTKYLGSNVTDGKVVDDLCIVGFDKITFAQGSTAMAFNFYLVDEWYNIPLFSKRALSRVMSLLRRQADADTITIPPGQEDNPFVELANQTATLFGGSLSDNLWATYPNPFNNLAAAPEMKDSPELLMVDGSETGETIPLRPLIQPQRALDFIIAYDSTGDDPAHGWVNGTNFYNTYLSSSQSGGKLLFPEVPPATTLVNTNATMKPTFFGCDPATPDTPLVLYLPNYPWSAYSNFTYMKPSFSPLQLNLTLENAFNVATYGNGALPDNEGADWATCVACAAIKKSLERADVDEPAACGTCWEKYCWKGETDDAPVTVASEGAGPRLLLNASLGFQEWNTTVWLSEGDGAQADGDN